MTKKAVSAVLGGALALGSFLSLGMGMDMGTSWAPAESHDCCPGHVPEKGADSDCCLLLPGALSAPVAFSAPLLAAFVFQAEALPAARSGERRSGFVHGPPGASSPGHAAPAAPRAPPVA